MTNEQILKKAMEKAEKNGFDGDGYELGLPLNIIFRHDFAKAFWGEEKVVYMQIVGGDSRHRWKAYEYYLMRMVLEKEPLKYLEKFL